MLHCAIKLTLISDSRDDDDDSTVVLRTQTRALPDDRQHEV